MKKNCEIVNDLLPLYIDNVCSESSSKLVEDHLKKCNECQQTFKIMNKEVSNESIDKNNDNKKYKRLFKKIKFKYIITTFLISLIVVFLSLAIFTGEFKNILAWININSYKTMNKSNQFFKALKENDYDKIENLFTEDTFREIFKTEFTDYTKEDFFANLKLLKEKGVKFTKIKFKKLEWHNKEHIFDGFSDILYNIYYKYNGKENYLKIYISLDSNDKDKIFYFGYANNDIDQLSIAREITNTFNPVIYYRLDSD